MTALTASSQIQLHTPYRGGTGKRMCLPAPPGLGQRVRIAAELWELNRIGVNLNQMARTLNSGAVSSPVGVLYK